MIVTGFLIVRSDGTMRVNKKAARLASDEVAFPMTVQIPDTWGSIQEDATIEVVLPEPPPATVAVGGPAVLDPSFQEEEH